MNLQAGDHRCFQVKLFILNITSIATWWIQNSHQQDHCDISSRKYSKGQLDKSGIKRTISNWIKIVSDKVMNEKPI